jgi:hypothetical protein
VTRWHVRLSILPVLLIAALPLTASSQPATSTVIETSGSVPQGVVDRHRQIIEGAMAFYTRQFRENPVASVVLHLSENTDRQALELTRVLKWERTRAESTARNFRSITMESHIFINLTKHPDPEHHVAHELLHVWQRAWAINAGDRGRGPQWLLEGMADVYGAQFAATVADPEFFQKRIESAYAAIDARWGDVSRLSLSSLISLDQWMQMSIALRGSSYSSGLVYAVATAAYAHLEEQSSRPAVVGFLKNMGRGAAYRTAFSDAFKMTPDEFEASLKRHLRTEIGR